jgi:hypothetical protein
MTVLVIIVVLAVLVIGLFDQLQARSERVNCTANLRSLFAGFQAYIVQQGHWPQNPYKIAQKDYDGWWIDELSKIGVPEKSWYCPTHTREAKAAAKAEGKANTEMILKKHREIHYMPTPFDENQATPRRWPTQPWLVETGNFHGDGPLIIFPDGTVSSFGQFIRQGH